MRKKSLEADADNFAQESSVRRSSSTPISASRWRVMLKLGYLLFLFNGCCDGADMSLPWCHIFIGVSAGLGIVVIAGATFAALQYQKARVKMRNLELLAQRPGDADAKNAGSARLSRKDELVEGGVTVASKI